MQQFAKHFGVCTYIFSNVLKTESDSKSRYDRHSVGQSPTWCQAPFWAQDQIFVTGIHLRVCCCGAPFLTVGRVCRLQLLLALASVVILGSESRRLETIFYCLRIETPPNLEGQVPPRNRVAQLYHQALCSLSVVSYDSQGYGGGIRAHLYAGLKTAFTLNNI
jgi:hypothetical protein